MNVVTYYRISRKGTGLGLESQQDFCQAAIEQNNWKEIATFTDDGFSGALPAEQRPGLKAALEQCAKHNACLLVAKVDRLARRVSEVARIMELTCVKVATMANADNFQIHLFAALAEQELVFIKSRIKAAVGKLQDRADAGDKVAQAKIERRNANLPPVRHLGNAASAAVRSAAADAYATSIEDNILAAKAKGHTSLRAIAAYLDSKGIKTPRGAAFTAAAVQRIINRIEA